MSAIINVEIKAVCNNPAHIQSVLEKQNAIFQGVDHQIDTYFNVPEGRLKLREGNIENSLIFYVRNEVKGQKTSNIELVKLDETQVPSLKQLLTKVHGLKLIVEKHRSIYFIDNVKFHIDEVKNLGNFIEIEAINANNEPLETLKKQCNIYQELFGLKQADYLDKSYSDMF